MKPIIPLFFAADANYIPYLAVTLKSIIENRSDSYIYRAHILHADMDENNFARVKAMAEPGFEIEFCNVSEKLKKLGRELRIRDYYTCATYYRIFIAEMFPQFDKALYLDCDTVVNADIAELYDTNIEDRLVGAVTDLAVVSEPVFRKYVQTALGIHPDKYFNAGVLVLNLKKMRNDDFYSRFTLLLRFYKFPVAQDQDYLNVLCGGKVAYISDEWNKMPIGDCNSTPKLVHYNLTKKPWHYADVPYSEYFWYYAKDTAYYDEIRRTLNDFDAKQMARDIGAEKHLLRLAEEETNDPFNYVKRMAALSAKDIIFNEFGYATVRT